METHKNPVFRYFLQKIELGKHYNDIPRSECLSDANNYPMIV
jgi:hypothetical protein